jgi:hypothetical protein
MHAGFSFSYSPISLLLRQPLSIKKSYAGAIHCLYMGQSLYATKFIRDKVYSGTKFIQGQGLYGDKVYTGTKFIRGQRLYGTKFI